MLPMQNLQHGLMLHKHHKVKVGGKIQCSMGTLETLTLSPLQTLCILYTFYIQGSAPVKTVQICTGLH